MNSEFVLLSSDVLLAVSFFEHMLHVSGHSWYMFGWLQRIWSRMKGRNVGIKVHITWLFLHSTSVLCMGPLSIEPYTNGRKKSTFNICIILEYLWFVATSHSKISFQTSFQRFLSTGKLNVKLTNVTVKPTVTLYCTIFNNKPHKKVFIYIPNQVLLQYM